MKLIIISIIFIIGLLFLCSYKSSDLYEGFENNQKEECPNLLIQKGQELHLIYNNKARIPGVNPVKFKNLEDYTEFLRWQRAKGIRCPVLYFQQTYDAQNKVGYRMLPDPIDKRAGMSSHIPHVAKEQPLYDANHDDMPYNQKDYAGFDPQDQYIGAYTSLDKNFRSSEKKRANAMDLNWGGSAYSENSVTGGVFDGDKRNSNDNPYISKEKNISFQQDMPQKLDSKSTHKVKNMSAGLQKEIASRYGGSIINTAETRSIGAPERATK